MKSASSLWVARFSQLEVKDAIRSITVLYTEEAQNFPGLSLGNTGSKVVPTVCIELIVGISSN